MGICSVAGFCRSGKNPGRFLVQADRSHQEEGLDLGHGSPQDRAHVVAHAGQQDAEQGDAHQGVAHAEQLSVPGPRRQVPKPWGQASHKAQSLVFIQTLRGQRNLIWTRFHW